MALGNQAAFRAIICPVPFPAKARGAARGKTSPEGTCKSLPSHKAVVFPPWVHYR